jgi:hypothetical protein
LYFKVLHNRAVISTLYFRREKAGGQLLHLAVVGQTITAAPLPGAGLVSAGAIRFISFFFAFHFENTMPFKDISYASQKKEHR